MDKPGRCKEEGDGGHVQAAACWCCCCQQQGAILRRGSEVQTSQQRVTQTSISRSTKNLTTKVHLLRRGALSTRAGLNWPPLAHDAESAVDRVSGRFFSLKETARRAVQLAVEHRPRVDAEGRSPSNGSKGTGLRNDNARCAGSNPPTTFEARCWVANSSARHGGVSGQRTARP